MLKSGDVRYVVTLLEEKSHLQSVQYAKLKPKNLKSLKILDENQIYLVSN